MVLRFHRHPLLGCAQGSLRVGDQTQNRCPAPASAFCWIRIQDKKFADGGLDQAAAARDQESPIKLSDHVTTPAFVACADVSRDPRRRVE
jgi:hypothetical protein